MEDAVQGGTTYRVAAVVAALVALAVVIASLVIVIGVPRWFPGVAECSVTEGERTVELSTEDAEKPRRSPQRRCGCAVRPERPRPLWPTYSTPRRVMRASSPRR